MSRQQGGLLILRVLAISLGAPVAANWLIATVLADPFAWIGLPFAMAGSLFLLTPGYAAMVEASRPLWVRYVGLILIGAIGGGLLLALPSFYAPFEASLMGGGYGLTTALCWIVFHATTRRETWDGIRAVRGRRKR